MVSRFQKILAATAVVGVGLIGAVLLLRPRFSVSINNLRQVYHVGDALQFTVSTLSAVPESIALLVTNQDGSLAVNYPIQATSDPYSFTYSVPSLSKPGTATLMVTDPSGATATATYTVA